MSQADVALLLPPTALLAMIRCRVAAPLCLFLVVAGPSAWSQPPAASPPTSAPAENSQPAASAISDWALAGVLWSDAHLVKRLAADVAPKVSDDQKAQLKQLSDKSDVLIGQLESFGWGKVAAAPPAATSARSTPPPVVAPGTVDESADPAGVMPAAPDALPDPADVAASVAEELGVAAGPQPSNTPAALTVDGVDLTPPPLTPAARRAGNVAQSRRAAAIRGNTVSGSIPPGAGVPGVVAPGARDEVGGAVAIVDTETPPGDDPGIDDELARDPERFDLGQYRVDDYIDETGRERRNTADAIEDGAEAALAAAAGRFQTDGRAGRISQREIQTRSDTLPYSRDSIYDADDYDPDVDYDAENPRGVISGLSRRAAIGQGSDGVDDIDGEDELVASLAGQPQTTTPALRATDPVTDRRNLLPPSTRVPGQPLAAMQPTAATPPAARPAPGRVARYSPVAAEQQQDAAWVQLRLDTNQQQYRMIAAQLPELSPAAASMQVNAAVMQMRSSAASAFNATTDPKLKEVLRQVP